jgi:hypothetical protein
LPEEGFDEDGEACEAGEGFDEMEGGLSDGDGEDLEGFIT